jgi:ParB-like chromosome segregation protein Spo0J
MMNKIQFWSVDKVKRNPKNPRVIKDAKFQQLVESIDAFPKMMKLRPIIVDERGMILGGDKRFLACIELGWDKIPVIQADTLTAKEKRDFILKDNVNFGDWDQDLLTIDERDLLIDYGFDFPDLEKKKVKVNDTRQITFRYNEKQYLKVMQMLTEVMEVTGDEEKEKVLIKLLQSATAKG